MIKKISLLAVLMFLNFAATDLKTYGQRMAKPRTRNITVRFTASGYHPKSIQLRKGVRTRLTFVRQSDEECGKELFIPAFNVTRDLPINQPVTVEIIPRRNGTFGFSCGMHMFRGRLIVS